MDGTQKAREGPGRERGRARAPAALPVAGLLAMVDVFFLGIAVAFGPEGFGGDGTPTDAQRLRASIGEWAGMSGLALALVAVGVVALVRAPARNRLLTAVVSGEALAVLVLIGSTLG